MISTKTIGAMRFQAHPLALGCWVFGGEAWGGQEEKDSIEAIHTARELGVNHFDTAQGYGKGLSEKILGRELKKIDREKIFVASKLFLKPKPQEIQISVEESLKRLQMEYIDLFYIHWPHKKIDFRLGLEVLQKLKEAGKIKGIGVSNFTAEAIEKASGIAQIEAHQVGYSLCWRWDEKDLFFTCAQKNISIVAYSALAQGILTGKFKKFPVFKKGDHRKHTVFFRKELWPHVYEFIEKLKKVAQEVDMSLSALALKWTCKQEAVDSVLFGARDAKQVRENLRFLEHEVGDPIFDQMTHLSNELHQKLPDTENIFDFHP